MYNKTDSDASPLISGIETARALHATGAKLFLPVRNIAKAEPIREDILKTSPGKGEITLMHLDLEDLDSVRACAKEFLAQTQQLNILVNNAGGVTITHVFTPNTELTLNAVRHNGGSRAQPDQARP